MSSSRASFETLFQRMQDEGRIAPDLGHPRAPQVFSVIADGMFWRRVVDPAFDGEALVPATLQVLAGLLKPVPRPESEAISGQLRPNQGGSIMRKILIGAVLAVAFVMISLTLVGRSLPRPSGPAESQAAKDRRRWSCSPRW